ncbi:MAG: hypothetical protein IPI97_14980 [Nitrosomonas sp.]|jgi:hypothetical protein|nr:hypothetical protein [Nitrosomonas sp.]
MDKIDLDYEEKKDIRMIVGFVVFVLLVSMMVAVTTAAVKYITEESTSDYTHIYYAPCEGGKNGQE